MVTPFLFHRVTSRRFDISGMKAWLGGVALLALLAVASVQAHKQTLLETDLADADVVTKTGKKIPVSQVRGRSAADLRWQGERAPRGVLGVAASAACAGGRCGEPRARVRSQERLRAGG